MKIIYQTLILTVSILLIIHANGQRNTGGGHRYPGYNTDVPTTNRTTNPNTYRPRQAALYRRDTNTNARRAINAAENFVNTDDNNNDDDNIEEFHAFEKAITSADEFVLLKETRPAVTVALRAPTMENWDESVVHINEKQLKDALEIDFAHTFIPPSTTTPLPTTSTTTVPTTPKILPKWYKLAAENKKKAQETAKDNQTTETASTELPNNFNPQTSFTTSDGLALPLSFEEWDFESRGKLSSSGEIETFEKSDTDYDISSGEGDFRADKETAVWFAGLNAVLTTQVPESPFEASVVPLNEPTAPTTTLHHQQATTEDETSREEFQSNEKEPLNVDGSGDIFRIQDKYATTGTPTGSTVTTVIPTTSSATLPNTVTEDSSSLLLNADTSNFWANRLLQVAKIAKSSKLELFTWSTPPNLEENLSTTTNNSIENTTERNNNTNAAFLTDNVILRDSSEVVVDRQPVTQTRTNNVSPTDQAPTENTKGPKPRNAAVIQAEQHPTSVVPTIQTGNTIPVHSQPPTQPTKQQPNVVVHRRFTFQTRLPTTTTQRPPRRPALPPARRPETQTTIGPANVPQGLLGPPLQPQPRTREQRIQFPFSASAQRALPMTNQGRLIKVFDAFTPGAAGGLQFTDTGFPLQNGRSVQVQRPRQPQSPPTGEKSETVKEALTLDDKDTRSIDPSTPSPPPPVAEGTWGEWSPWARCNQAGKAVRRRHCLLRGTRASITHCPEGRTYAIRSCITLQQRDVDQYD